MLVAIVFVAVYLGMAVGRVPGLRIDRTGIALVGAVLVITARPALLDHATSAIDFPTLLLLGSLMLVSLQLEVSGFYTYVAHRLAAIRATPTRLLALVVLAVGGLSAVLTNDVVVFALTPTLVRGLKARGLDPKPFLLAAAAASNAGSAATLIGNPQNVLIGQVGRLSFSVYLLHAALPALLALLVVWGGVAYTYRDAFALAQKAAAEPEGPDVEKAGVVKGVTAMGIVVGILLFGAGVHFVVAVAAMLLVSRYHPSRTLLGRVDWPLLLLFVGLFVVTDAFVREGTAQVVLDRVGLSGQSSWGTLRVLGPLTLVGGNTIGNVPLVALLLPLWPQKSPATLTSLAVLATLAGNLLVTGSMANIIVVERAAQNGVGVSFREHARVGIPITLVSMALAAVALVATGDLSL